MTKNVKVRCTIRIPKELYKRVLEKADKIGISFNAVVVQDLWAIEGKEKETSAIVSQTER